MATFQLEESVRGPSPLSKITIKRVKRQFTLIVQHYKHLELFSRLIPEVSLVLLQRKYL
jgi:hypothetical protein